ncbi:hypothetical protein HDU87_003248 [Geranomyces variabilis]|uniref:Uncharacterized protein n=1 Tax=Geranomyces variabilis TaxID=109894 RepID=A0AAD5TMM5_9FUNG|nr:hypothetical protein HDU87_003248 [Geranomyces variabilis]
MLATTADAHPHPRPAKAAAPAQPHHPPPTVPLTPKRTSARPPRRPPNNKPGPHDPQYQHNQGQQHSVGCLAQRAPMATATATPRAGTSSSVQCIVLDTPSPAGGGGGGGGNKNRTPTTIVIESPPDAQPGGGGGFSVMPDSPTPAPRQRKQNKNTRNEVLPAPPLVPTVPLPSVFSLPEQHLLAPVTQMVYAQQLFTAYQALGMPMVPMFPMPFMNVPAAAAAPQQQQQPQNTAAPTVRSRQTTKRVQSPAVAVPSTVIKRRRTTAEISESPAVCRLSQRAVEHSSRSPTPPPAGASTVPRRPIKNRSGALVRERGVSGTHSVDEAPIMLHTPQRRQQHHQQQQTITATAKTSPICIDLRSPDGDKENDRIAALRRKTRVYEYDHEDSNGDDNDDDGNSELRAPRRRPRARATEPVPELITSPIASSRGGSVYAMNGSNSAWGLGELSVPGTQPLTSALSTTSSSSARGSLREEQDEPDEEEICILDIAHSQQMPSSPVIDLDAIGAFELECERGAEDCWSALDDVMGLASGAERNGSAADAVVDCGLTAITDGNAKDDTTTSFELLLSDFASDAAAAAVLAPTTTFNSAGGENPPMMVTSPPQTDLLDMTQEDLNVLLESIGTGGDAAANTGFTDSSAAGADGGWFATSPAMGGAGRGGFQRGMWNTVGDTSDINTAGGGGCTSDALPFDATDLDALDADFFCGGFG